MKQVGKTNIKFVSSIKKKNSAAASSKSKVAAPSKTRIATPFKEPYKTNVVAPSRTKGSGSNVRQKTPRKKRLFENTEQGSRETEWLYDVLGFEGQT